MVIQTGSQNPTFTNLTSRPDTYLSQILVLIVANWGYSVLGSGFVNISEEYQWTLALLTPFIKDLYSKALYGAEDNKSIKFLTQHYVITKHAIFLAVMIGGVSTPTTSLCIMAIDFAKTMQSGWKIIKKHKTNPNNEGRYWFQTCPFKDLTFPSFF